MTYSGDNSHPEIYLSSRYLDWENSPPRANYALRQKFHRIFTHGWDFIVKQTPESNWKTVKKYKLTEQKLWYKYTDVEQIIGLRFGTETTYGLYDIDWGSQYDPREQEESLFALKAKLEEYGIVAFALVQSSDSGGLHLYFFLDRPVNTFRLACVMNKAAASAQLEIKRGQLETFPNTKRYNSLFNGHRLPLQQGSYLLDKDYTPYSNRLEHFLNAAAGSAERNDTDLLESKFDEAYDWFLKKKNQERIYSPTPEDREFIEQVDYAQQEIKEGFLNQIRTAIEQGFTGEGETNELLLTIAKLGRILHGLTGERYINYITETVTSCPGYAQYCRHKHEINRRCAEVARYGEQQWYPYRTRLPQSRSTYKQIKQSLTNKTNLNLERQHNARSRITQAVAIIQQQGQLPLKVGECKLAIRNVTKELFSISVSDRTLNKPENLPLWHPKHRLLPTTKPTPPRPKKIDDSPLPTTPKTAPNNTENPTNVHSTTLQPKPSNNHQHSQRATPLSVVRKAPEQLKTVKAIFSNDFQLLCHTLPNMKGMLCVLSLEMITRLFQRVYAEAVIKNQTRNLVFIYQGFKGKSASGLVEKKKAKLRSFESIPINSFVTIQTNQLHSTYFRDDSDQILVYIKPLTLSDDWLSGIAVPLKSLSPYRYNNKILNQAISSKSDQDTSHESDSFPRT